MFFSCYVNTKIYPARAHMWERFRLVCKHGRIFIWFFIEIFHYFYVDSVIVVSFISANLISKPVYISVGSVSDIGVIKLESKWPKIKFQACLSVQFCISSLRKGIDTSTIHLSVMGLNSRVDWFL